MGLETLLPSLIEDIMRQTAALERIAASLEAPPPEPELLLSNTGMLWRDDRHVGDVTKMAQAEASDVWERLTGRQARDHLRSTAGIWLFSPPTALDIVSVTRVREAMKHLVKIMEPEDWDTVQEWLEEIETLEKVRKQK